MKNKKLFEIFNGKHCIVTGGAGFIGSNLAYFLLEIGANIIVIDNFSTGRKENLDSHLSKNLLIINADLSEADKTQKYFEGIDYIYHLTAATEFFLWFHPFCRHNLKFGFH